MKIEDVIGDLGRHVRDAVLITAAEPIDAPGPRIVWVNDAFTEMTGFTPEDAIGESPRILQGDDTDRAALDRIRECLEAWRPCREILKNYTKAGEPFWVELDIKPIADSTGWYRYWVSVQRDVTELVERQDELEAAKKAAETANQMKSEFLANMSHEIRTPLNGALGMAQVLALTELDARQRRAVETIISSGQSLLGLIEDVLDLSRVEAGRLELEAQPTTARALLEATADAVRGLMVSKGLELRLETGAGADAEFMVDPRRARQVLINLAGNAAKFTEAGQVTLACFVRDESVVFEVRDSGPGVPEHLRETIFQRFRQGDGSLSRAHEGAGLGLAIAARIVSAAGGTISVDEAREGGACFTMTLPFHHADQGRIGAIAAGQANGAAGGAAGGRTALLIEDNPVNRAVVEDALGLSGWTVKSAERAELGLEAFQSGSYSLVIVDRQMPGLNGEQAIVRLRASERDSGRARTPVLMLTAHAMAGAEAAALKAGADAYLAKPLDLERLIALADELTVAAQ